MSRRLRYFAQPFWAGRRELAARYEFPCAMDAEEGGDILARSADGVLVYQQYVDEDAQIFDEPEVLQKLGQVPLAALTIDGEGVEPWLGVVA
jgi:hypothetical protein